jgi:hypothetical protein
MKWCQTGKYQWRLYDPKSPYTYVASVQRFMLCDGRGSIKRGVRDFWCAMVVDPNTDYFEPLGATKTLKQAMKAAYAAARLS